MNSAHVPSSVSLCVDGRMLIDSGTGVSTYARSLRAAMALIADAPMILSPRPGRPLLPHWLAGAGPGRQTVRPERAADGAAHLQATDLYRRAHVHFGYHQRLYRLRSPALPFGIMHWSYPVPMRMEGWINIYTVHDMIPIERPDLTPIDQRRHLAVLRAITASADKIVTVSENARQSIIAGLGCDPALVVDSGQAADVEPCACGSAGCAALPAGLERGGYLLIVGSLEPRKNIDSVLAAYRASQLSIPLVIAGPDGWQAAAISQAIAGTPGAIRLPYLSRTDLLHVIAGARALLFASLAEGFGLPMIEAMTLGTAVLTSDRGALAEIAGDAALLVDPTDPVALQQAITRIATDAPLRDQLIARGSARAARFSLPDFADRLRGVYQQALDARRHPAGAALP